MSFFVQATPATPPRTKNIISISLLAAGIITAMIIGQLFTFEDFPAVIAALWLPGGEVVARSLAAFLVVAELLALPFLLSMPSSPLFRIVSMVLGWIVAGLWLGLAVWENVMVMMISNSGIFGATIPLPVGWWTVLFSLTLSILLGWAAWGMWPRLYKPEEKASRGVRRSIKSRKGSKNGNTS